MSEPDDRLRELRAERDAAVQREALFRYKTASENLQREVQLQALHDRIGELNTYIHRLHLERVALREELERRRADLERLTWKAARGEAAAAALDRAKGSLWWRWVKNRARFHAPRPPDGSAAPGEFNYHFPCSPYRGYTPGPQRFAGWVVPADGGRIVGVRVRVDDRLFGGTYGLPDAEAEAGHHVQPANPRPGFELDAELAEGRHDLVFEAEVETQGWRRFLWLPIWVERTGGP